MEIFYHGAKSSTRTLEAWYKKVGCILHNNYHCRNKALEVKEGFALPYQITVHNKLQGGGGTKYIS